MSFNNDHINDDLSTGGGRGEFITRQNYEEYFLLYVDNELTVSEKRTVEDFIEQNPDLEEELVMLQQSVLRPDQQLLFDKKEALLKNVPASGLVNETNYEEYFVLYGDNELTNKQKDLVEQFVYKHPQYQAEFELIQQVKLMPDNTIVFPGKHYLYRTEEDDKVVPFPWRKIAVAAVILLFIGGFGWYASINKTGTSFPNEITEAIVSIDTVNTEKINKDSQTTEQLVTVENKDIEKNTLQPETVKTTPRNKKEFIAADKNNQVKDLLADKGTVKNNKTTISNNPPAENVLPDKDIKVEDRTFVAKQVTNRTLADVTAQPAIDVAVNERDARTDLNLPDTQIIYIDDQPVDDNETYVANTSVNKGPLRGFFRKVTRVFDKATSSEPNENNKKGVRIAAFEIALK